MNNLLMLLDFNIYFHRTLTNIVNTQIGHFSLQQNLNSVHSQKIEK